MKTVTEKQANENLANAIIAKAVDDYKSAYSAYLRNPQDIAIQARLDEVRVFFKGQWYGHLTTLDADYLVNQIENECKKKHALKMQLVGKRKGNNL